MTRSSRRATRSLILPALLAAACGMSWGQAIKVRPIAPRPRALFVFDGTLTLSASPATVTFALVSKGTAQGSEGVTVTTAWDVVGFAPALSLYGWLGSSTQALSDGRTPADVIPSSAVLGQMTTGSPVAYTPFTETTPLGVAGAGLTLLNGVAITGSRGFTYSGSRTDVLNLEINLSGVPSLPAGTYRGTLTLQASMN